MVVVRSRTMVVSMACGDGGLDGRQFAADIFNRLDDVGAGLAKDDDRDGRLAVEVAGGTDVLHRVCHVGDIGEADGGAVVVADDERPVISGVLDLVVGDDVGSDDAVRELAAGLVGILQAQTLTDMLQSVSP